MAVSITALLIAGIIGVKSDAKNSAIENYNKVYASLNDAQKHKADSLPPVCTEETFNEYRYANLSQSDEIIAEVAE